MFVGQMGDKRGKASFISKGSTINMPSLKLLSQDKCINTLIRGVKIVTEKKNHVKKYKLISASGI